MAEIINTERLPFPLAKPNEDTYVTKADQIGYGEGSAADAIDEVKEITDSQRQKETDAYYVCDSNGNVVAKIDNKGLTTVGVKSGKMSDIQSDKLHICDSNGNVVAEFNQSGLDLLGLRLLVNGELVDILTLIGSGGGGTGNAINEWEGKTIAFYGDSVTAICNGDFQAPYTSRSEEHTSELQSLY